MKRLNASLLPALLVTSAVCAQGVITAPRPVPLPDAIAVTGTTSVDVNAVVNGTVDPGGDAVGGLGSRRFEAKVGFSAAGATGKADVHGPTTAVDTGGAFGNRGVFHSYTDVGGQGAGARNATLTGTSTFTFSAVPPFAVRGFVRTRLSGEGVTFGGETFSATASITATATPANTNSSAIPNSAGGVTRVGAVFALPGTAVITQTVGSTANGVSRVRTTINATAEFVPTRIWIPSVTIPLIGATPVIVIYQR